MTNVKGVTPDMARLARGTERHAQHGRAVRLAVWQVRVGLALLALAAFLIAWSWLR